MRFSSFKVNHDKDHINHVNLYRQDLSSFVILGPYTFSIGDTSGLSDYVSGGYAIQCKMPKTLKFVRTNIFALG